MVRKTFVINGVTRNILVDENETLATFLRERLLLTGCKIGCGEGHCGACNVIVNGKVTRSCLTRLGKIKDGAEITTIEGIGTLSDLHPLQVAWMAHGCAHCGLRVLTPPLPRRCPVWRGSSPPRALWPPAARTGSTVWSCCR